MSTDHKGYGLLQDSVQGGAADPGALGDLRSGHAGLQGIGSDGGDLLHGPRLDTPGAGERSSQLVELAAGLDVGCVGHGATVKHLTASVNRVTMRASEKQGSRRANAQPSYSRSVIR